ncbi:MAG: zinc ribbon domain-containing protein [Oscillospiraceae bacterium]
MKILEDFIETSAKVADQVAKVAGEYIDKGKDKISVMSLESDLAKAQRQLGALVYVLHKTGEQNEELLDKYIEDVARIELLIANLKAAEAQNTAYTQSEEDCTCGGQITKECPQCGAEIGCCDGFCRACGAKIE